MIPKDIETDIQWRVRHQAPGGVDREVTRVGTEAQVRSIAKRLEALEPVIEARLIHVGEWADPAEVSKAAEALGEDPDDEGDDA